MLGLKVQDYADFSAEIIRKVREHGALSRVELARELGVAASTIGRHVDAIIASGYFSETVEPTKEAGRPPTRLRPVPGRGCFIGVDFHASHLFATAVDFAQHRLVEKAFPLDAGKGVEVVLASVTRAIKEMQEAAQIPVLAVGVATPGRVDTLRGMGLLWSHCPGWKDVPVAAHVKGLVQARTFVENNIRTMALAERWFGEPRGCQHLICLGVRVGVSAGVIREGRLATGFRELGGEVRGWSCPVFDATKEKWEWVPGATLEKYGAVPAVIARYAKLSGNKKATQEDFFEAIKMSDKHALVALREIAAVHGWAISQMVQLVDPEIVVLAGPLTSIGAPYLDAVTNFALQFESDYHPSVPIRSSELGEYAGAVGAAALALQRWRPDDVG